MPHKEKHYLWKGNKADVHSIHQWIIYNYGNPKKCVDCGKVGERVKRNWNICWSNKDHKYRRVKKDWKGRCQKCHMQYDIKKGLFTPSGKNQYN